MLTRGELRIEPAAEILSAARGWLDRIRPALGNELLAAYLTGSVLTEGFDPKRSHVNILVVLRTIDADRLDAIAGVLPRGRSAIRFEPLFLTQTNIERTLDTFPIEWTEIQERHLRLEGDDLFSNLDVPRRFLRLQCEHELRGKHLQLRQAYIANHGDAAALRRLLVETASGFATLFRTLLRLAGESPPADSTRVIERIADRFGIDAQGVLAPHLLRYTGRRYGANEMVQLYRRFMSELDRLVIAIDQLPVS